MSLVFLCYSVSKRIFFLILAQSLLLKLLFRNPYIFPRQVHKMFRTHWAESAEKTDVGDNIACEPTGARIRRPDCIPAAFGMSWK